MLEKLRAFVTGLTASGLLLAAVPLWAAETIRDVQVANESDHTQLVITLSGPVKYTTVTLSKPDRIVVDLRDTRLAVDLNKLPLQDTPIKRVRSGVQKGTDTRLVLDLANTAKARTALRKADGANQLVVDLYGAGGARPTAGSETRAAAPAPEPVAVAAPAKPVKAAGGAGQRDIIIAIDAGHGGDDPGAIGPGHLQEKQVAFAIARELADLFERERGYRPVLTRKSDVFLPLKTRRDLARKAQADLMVSIHADAFSDGSAEGGSVFALSNRGATSTMAAFLATRENEADAIGGVPTEGKDEDLVKVLTDLSLTATMDASMRVGRQVLGSMGGVTRLHTRRVEQAAFVVLKSPDTPSILVETGFISNPREAKRLASRDYQQQMARAIFNGINRYFSQSPPPNTYLARVKRGGSQQAAARDDNVASAE